MSDGFLEDLPKVESFLREKHGLVRKEDKEGIVFEKQENPEAAVFATRETEGATRGKGAEMAKSLREKNIAKAHEIKASKRFR